MKKLFLTLSFLIAVNLFCYSQKAEPKKKNTIHANKQKQTDVQKIPQNDMIPMFQYWGKKNWDSVYIVTSEILRKYPNDTSNFKSNINYAFIIAAAAKTAAHKMTYPELREAVRPLLGKLFLTPVHATTTDKKLNQAGVTLITSDKSGSKATTIIRSTDEKTILSIEEFNFKKKIKLTNEYRDKFIRCGGKLYSIEINSKMDDIWIMHLVFIDGYHL
jgi:hypothetical protein